MDILDTVGQLDMDMDTAAIKHANKLAPPRIGDKILLELVNMLYHD